MSRDSIFISHAVLPKDNEFVLWLASRLQMLGYNVWCDLFNLKGGEHDFWGKVIEPQIRINSAKFIVIVTKAGIVRQGVIDEYLFARDIATEYDLKDFVIPIRIEEVPFTARISLNSYNVINCVENWQDGLSSLLKKLEADGIHKENVAGLSDQFKNIILNNFEKIHKKNELYYTSWLRPLDMPKSFFLFKYDSEGQTKAILRHYYKEYPIIRHGNHLISFHNKINTTPKKNNQEFDLLSFNVLPGEIMEIEIAEITNNTSSIFPTKQDCEYLLKRLFNWTLSFHLFKRGLRSYDLANKKSCYFFPNNYKPGNKITVQYHNRKKRKNLVGKFIEGFWHFGVSFRFQLTPYPSYDLKTHILFSEDGQNIWNSTSKLHAARRKKGRTWFNEQWRDQLMAFLFYTATEYEKDFISLPISDSFYLNLPLLTESYSSDFGYNEPNVKARMDIINSKDDEIEINQEVNEEFE